MAYAHARGVIHRDLKPDNVALGEYGEVIVLDWGLARVLGQAISVGTMWTARLQHTHETAHLQTQGVMDARVHLPEAALEDLENVDERSDVYGLGAILFEILTGSVPHPFPARRFRDRAQYEDALANYIANLRDRDAPLATSIQSDVPAELSALCAQAVQRDRARRLESAAALAQGIRDWQAQSAVAREADVLFREAKAALGSAESLKLEGRAAEATRELERVDGLCRQVLKLRPNHAEAERLRQEASVKRDVFQNEVRGQIQQEAEREARRRTGRRLHAVILVALVLVAAVSGFAALIWNQRTQEADEARRGERKAKEAALRSAEDALKQRGIADAKAAEATRATEVAKGALQSAKDAQQAAETSAAEAEEQKTIAQKSAEEAQKQRAIAETREGEAKAAAERAVESALSERAAADRERRNLAAAYAHLARTFDAAGRAAAVSLSSALSLRTSSSREGWEALTRAGQFAFPAFRAYECDCQPTCAVASPSRAFVACTDGVVRAWDLETGQLIEVSWELKQDFRRLFLASKGTRLVSLHPSHLRLWDARDLRLLEEHRFPPEWGSEECCLMRAGAQNPKTGDLYIAGGSPSILVWEDAKGAFVRPLVVEGDGVSCLTVSDDGRQLAAGATRGVGASIVVWDLSTGAVISQLPVEGMQVTALRFSEGVGALHAAVETEPNVSELRRYALDGSGRAETLQGHRRDAGVVTEMSGGAVPSTLLVGRDAMIEVWDAAARRLVRTIPGRAPLLADAATHRVMCGRRPNGLLLYDSKEWKVVASLALGDGHRAGVRALAVSDDGKRLCSGGESLRVWDVDSGANIEIAADMTGGAFLSIVLTRSGKRAYVIRARDGVSGTLELYDLESRTSLPLPEASQEPRLTVLLRSPDGQQFYSGGPDGEVRVWDMATGKLRKPFTNLAKHQGPVLALAVTADGQWLYSAGGGPTERRGPTGQDPEEDNRILRWNTKTGELKGLYSGHSAAVTALEVTPNGDVLYSGGRDGRVLKWPEGAIDPVVALEAPGRGFTGLALRADGAILYAGLGDVVPGRAGNESSSDSFLWGISTEKAHPASRLDGHAGAIGALAMAPGHNVLYTGGAEDRRILEWRKEAPAKVGWLSGNHGAIVDMVMSPDHKLLVTTSANWFGRGDSSTRVWGVTTGSFTVLNLTTPPLTCPEGVRRLVLSPDGRRLFCIGSDPCQPPVEPGKPADSVRAIELIPEGSVRSTWSLRGPVMQLAAAVISNDGTRLYAGESGEGRTGSDETFGFFVWDAAATSMQQRPITRVGNFADPITAMTMSPDGRVLVCGDAAGRVIVWDVRSEKTTVSVTAHRAAVRALLVLSDRAAVVSGAADGSLRLLSLEDGSSQGDFAGHTDSVETIAVDRGRLFTGSRDGTIRVWDLASREMVAILSPRAGEIRALVIDPEVQRLYCGGYFELVFAWELPWFTMDAESRLREIEQASGLMIRDAKVLPVRKESFVEVVPGALQPAPAPRVWSR